MNSDYRVWGEGEDAEQVKVEDLGDGRYRLTKGELVREVDAKAHRWGVSLTIDGRSVDAAVEQDGVDSRVKIAGREIALAVQDERSWRLAQAMGSAGMDDSDQIESPMAGKVVLVRVEAGDSVEQGQTLVVIEAMKMENEIRARADVTVAEVCVGPGDTVNLGDVLVRFAQADED